MSRCYPYPPPGYAGNDTVIFSIKPQIENEKSNSKREREKAKSSDRKKEKKINENAKSSDGKKEKKRDKEKNRHKERTVHAIGGKKEKLVEKLYQADKYKLASRDKFSVGQDESEMLERSSVTEELGQPVDLQNASCFSDSTGNSSKRKRSSSPSSIQSHGNIIRIRLSSSHKAEVPSTSGRKEQESTMPSLKRKDISPSYSNVRPCSNISRTEPSIKQKDVIVSPQDNSTVASTLQLASKQDEKLSCLTEKKIESEPPKEKHSSLEKKIKLEPPKEKLSSHEKKILKRESQYKKLFEDWVPFVVPNELAVDQVDGEDWLFGRKKCEEPGAKRLNTCDLDSSGDNLKCCSFAVVQPRAYFLPDVDVHALPFTVPF